MAFAAASHLGERSSTTLQAASTASGTGLSPVTLSAHEHLTSELLRTP
jgi:hypothetical protein